MGASAAARSVSGPSSARSSSARAAIGSGRCSASWKSETWWGGGAWPRSASACSGATAAAFCRERPCRAVPCRSRDDAGRRRLLRLHRGRRRPLERPGQRCCFVQAIREMGGVELKPSGRVEAIERVADGWRVEGKEFEAVVVASHGPSLAATAVAAAAAETADPAVVEGSRDDSAIARVRESRCAVVSAVVEVEGGEAIPFDAVTTPSSARSSPGRPRSRAARTPGTRGPSCRPRRSPTSGRATTPSRRWASSSPTRRCGSSARTSCGWWGRQFDVARGLLRGDVEGWCRRRARRRRRGRRGHLRRFPPTAAAASAALSGLEAGTSSSRGGRASWAARRRRDLRGARLAPLAVYLIVRVRDLRARAARR